MEKSNQTNSFTCFIRKAWKIFLPVLFLLFTFFLILAVILPAKNAELTLPADAKIQMVNTSLLNDSLYRDIQDIESENAWLRARLNAANSDSLSLLINLPDSTLSLQMDGVIVFETQITKYKKSRLFNKYSRQFLAEWSEDPLTVTNTVSSIPKMPVVYKKRRKILLKLQGRTISQRHLMIMKIHGSASSPTKT